MSKPLMFICIFIIRMMVYRAFKFWKNFNEKFSWFLCLFEGKMKRIIQEMQLLGTSELHAHSNLKGI